jgi:hypothetical protein
LWAKGGRSYAYVGLAWPGPAPTMMMMMMAAVDMKQGKFIYLVYLGEKKVSYIVKYLLCQTKRNNRLGV